MTEKESALYSHYIIDGIRTDMSPAELLEECMEAGKYDFPDCEEFEDIIDETTEPPLTTFAHDGDKCAEYASRLAAEVIKERPFQILYPEHFTRLRIAKALLERLWSDGHFRLGDLRMWAQWEWNARPIGNMAAFYRSVSSASEYLYGLGVTLSDYIFMESDHQSSAKFFSWLPEIDGSDDSDDTTSEAVLFKASPYESSHPWISESRKCPSQFLNDPKSWILYIPFDTCSFRLGGSLLAQINGHNGGQPPKIMDPDYFIDCYEVLRELVEDGIVMSGTTVADGGLGTAIQRMCGEGGMDVDPGGIASSYQDDDPVRLMFGETPGVIVQISDDNYDYVDSQFILQDIAYYPIGRISSAHTGIRLVRNSRNGVADILASLLTQTSEGED